jgi:hypothetical protein
MKQIVCNTLYQEVCLKMLFTITPNWLGQRRNLPTSVPQLSNTSVFPIGPGAAAQPLHRDDMIHYNELKRVDLEDYTLG